MDILDHGFVARCGTPAQADGIAVGPRLAVLPDGAIVCSWMRNSATGVNDFVPMLSRSRDLGRHWSDGTPVWPRLSDKWSIFVSVSADRGGRVFLYGTRTAIDQPGETFWCEATSGLKKNELVWAVSADRGDSWPDPSPIAMPIAGAAEAPGALCAARSGRWLAPYSPYNTFDPRMPVDRSQVVVLFSDDGGQTWRATSMMRFADGDTGAAEAWLVELSDGRLLGTCWHVARRGGDLPNAFAISHAGGDTWRPTRSTGIFGQSTALAALPDGRALFVYNQRKHGEPGVWLATVRPSDSDFGVERNEIVWRAESPTGSATSGDLAEWTDFSFGEPSVAVLPDGSLLVALWCVEPSGSGIRYVRLRIAEA
jgi:hypothetical protein